MRAVIQRVTSASVTVDGTVISQISRGLMVLVGIGTDDTASDASLLINKILNLRVFNDPTDSEKMWKANVKDIDGEILCVSQFTLLAQTTKGNKPDFHRAMPAETSQVMYEAFLNQLRQGYKPDKVQGMFSIVTNLVQVYEDMEDGKFGAMMNVSLTNEGPVTFTLDSRKFEYIEPSGVEAGTKRKPSKTSGS